MEIKSRSSNRRQLCDAQAKPMSIGVMIDDHRYSSKPTGEDRLRILEGLKPAVLTIRQLADIISQGCCFCPGLFIDRTWYCQQLVLLEFHGKGYNPHEHKDECDHLGIQPAIIIPTWNHTEDNPRFRSIFVNTDLITDIKTLKACQQNLFNLFAGADQFAKGPKLLVYGSCPNFLYVDETETVDLLKI